MVTGRVVLTTITMLVPWHKEPAPPVTTASKQTPRVRPSVGHIVIPYVQGLGESIKHMQQLWFTDPLQGKQDSQTTSGSTQGQGPKGKEKWSNLPLPMPSNWLWGLIYWRNLKDPGGAVQGTPEGTLPNPGAQATHRTSYCTAQL